MNEEQKLEIKINGKYKNIDFKTELEVGNYIIVEKTSIEGVKKTGVSKKTGKSFDFYIMFAKYLDEEVSFLMYEQDFQEYKAAGGLGDKVKITAFEKIVVKGTTKNIYKNFKYDKI